jgi:hypothetical protein
MLRGNRNLALLDIKNAAFESLKESFSDRCRVNWDNPSGASAVQKFDILAEKISKSVTSDMIDVGDEAYIIGKLTKENIERGVIEVGEFYLTHPKARDKIHSFRKHFSGLCKKLEFKWKKLSDVYFE